MQADCPHCRATLKLPAELGGTVVRCPKCMETFRADAGATAVQTKPPLPAEPIPASLRESHPEPADHDGSDTGATILWIVGGAIVVILLLVVLGGAWFLFTDVQEVTTSKPAPAPIVIPPEDNLPVMKEEELKPDPKK
jgi:hypothetical protein